MIFKAAFQTNKNSAIFGDLFYDIHMSMVVSNRNNKSAFTATYGIILPGIRDKTI